MDILLKHIQMQNLSAGELHIESKSQQILTLMTQCLHLGA